MIAAQHIHKYSLINPGGSITISIGTVFNRPVPGWALVSGVNGATESVTRGISSRLGENLRSHLDVASSNQHICRVNTVSPGIVDTQFWDATPQDAKAGMFSHYEKNLLVGHIGTPAEVAEAYIFAMKVSNEALVAWLELKEGFV
ncbi:hypothetical protein FRC12_007882 [Ceratobasidium sp. 428]|nr:hypothetical protein FRC12_007882 [Ceratobasidium sp. 428]